MFNNGNRSPGLEALTRAVIMVTVERRDTMSVGMTFCPDTAYTRNTENTGEDMYS